MSCDGHPVPGPSAAAPMTGYDTADSCCLLSLTEISQFRKESQNVHNFLQYLDVFH